VTSATSFIVVVTPKVTLKLIGLKKGALKLGKRVTVMGKVTPATLAGSKVTLKVQKKKGHKWVTLKTVKRTIGHGGAYSWKYKPARRGSYRLQATLGKTTTTTAVTTKWRSFKVK
jgi:predicted secreted protein